MKEIYSSTNLTEVELRRAFLESAEIHAVILDAASQGTTGVAVVIRLVVLQESDAERAVVLLREFKSGSTGSESAWKCPACKEESEAQFTNCWKCGSKREDDLISSGYNKA